MQIRFPDAGTDYWKAIFESVSPTGEFFPEIREGEFESFGFGGFKISIPINDDWFIAHVDARDEFYFHIHADSGYLVPGAPLTSYGGTNQCYDIEALLRQLNPVLAAEYKICQEWSRRAHALFWPREKSEVRFAYELSRFLPKLVETLKVWNCR